MSPLCKHITTLIKLPSIIQAPMAGVSTIELAAAVTNAGGLGSIPVSSINLKTDFPTFAKTLYNYSKLLNNHLNSDKLMVNLNFFCHKIENNPTSNEISNWCNLYNKTLPNLNEKIDSKISDFANGNISFKEWETEENDSVLSKLFSFWEDHPELIPNVVSFHFGYPDKKSLIRFQHLGIKVLVSVTYIYEPAKIISTYDTGLINGLVLQGSEAGGHHSNIRNEESNISTKRLFEYSIKEVKNLDIKMDLIPAGGIMTAEDVQYYINSGASAVQMGSIFLATNGSNAKPYFEKLISNSNLNSDKLPETIVTNLVSGKSARTIKTPFIEKLIENDNELGSEPLPPYGYRYKAYKDLKKKEKDNIEMDLDFHLAGANYAKMSLNLTPEEIIKEVTKYL
ncbi:hypothetical protein C6P40_000973 [Pichia californica]|uniref:Nitronate monooxygenase domain-containing protein n=1 Tax=Pichia californica TaxID=460514 RepID=A0A9P6WJS9_9ASCO|nr:hypothetical protein C6P40_000973 [[Candida] californica]